MASTDVPTESEKISEFVNDDSLPTADAPVADKEDSGLPETVNTEPAAAPDLEAPPERPAVNRGKRATKQGVKKGGSTGKKTAKGSQSAQTTTKRTAKKKAVSRPAATGMPEKTSETPNTAPAAQQGSESGDPAPSPDLPAPRESRLIPPPAPSQAPKLPAPAVTGKESPPVQGDLVASNRPVLLGGSPLPSEMIHRWDEMMTTLSGNTRNAVWETGIQGMEELLRTARTDLVKPRGQLTEDQCQELEAWLGRNGYLIPRRAGVSPRGLRRPPGKAVDVKTGKQVNNRRVREARVERMKRMRTGG